MDLKYSSMYFIMLCKLHQPQQNEHFQEFTQKHNTSNKYLCSFLSAQLYNDLYSERICAEFFWLGIAWAGKCSNHSTANLNMQPKPQEGTYYLISQFTPALGSWIKEPLRDADTTEKSNILWQ